LTAAEQSPDSQQTLVGKVLAEQEPVILAVVVLSWLVVVVLALWLELIDLF